MALTTFEFYIYEPKAATNLCTNPAFVDGVTGWTALQSSIAQSTTEQRRGAYSCKVTPSTTSDDAYVYYTIALTDTVQYSFSIDVMTINGESYLSQVMTTAFALVNTPTTWTGNGHWQRRCTTYTATASGNFVFIIGRGYSLAATTGDFYVDGCLIEEGTESTYFDGDYVGFIPGQTDFGWNGAWNASTSWRSGQTRKGGTRTRLKDSLPAISVMGLGMPPVLNQSTPHNLGGSFYQNTIATDRTFSIVGELNGTTPGAFLTLRDALVDSISFRKTATPQPLVMEWRGLDATSNEAAETCLIECQYSGGLEGNWQEFGYEEIPLQFQTNSPYIKGDGNQAVSLGYQTSVANFQNIGYRDTDGQWKAMGTGSSSAADTVRVIKPHTDGCIYVGGDFAAMGGVANTAYLAKWNGTAWVSLGTGINARVWDIIFDAAGAMYVCGAFTDAGGVAAADGIAKTTDGGTTWTALGTGMTSGTAVQTLEFDNSGNLYAGGYFAEMGGVANTRSIAKWDGSTWTAVGTGVSSYTDVRDIKCGKDGYLYAAGFFAEMGGKPNTLAIARYNLLSAVPNDWSALGTGMTSGSGINQIDIDQKGVLYVAGDFLEMSGVSTPYIASWNGSAWSPLGSGADAVAYSVTCGSDGLVYIGGLFTTLNGINLPDKIGAWNGSTFLPLDVDVQGTAIIYTTSFDSRGRIYIGGDNFGATALSNTVTVPNIGSALVYPIVRVHGPGQLWQVKNYTTNRALYFNNLIVQASENILIDFNPERVRVYSYWRGNLLNYVLPGSDFDFPLVPGNNNIAAFMTSATSDAYMTMEYVDLFLSLDGAVF